MLASPGEIMNLHPECLTSPAFPRNRDPILSVLRNLWGAREATGVFEIASGPGQHICYFAESLPAVSWQPSERSSQLIKSISAWRDMLGLVNVELPLKVDADFGPWPDGGSFDGVIAINFWHMVGPGTVKNALAGAAGLLVDGGKFVVYDCFTFGGRHVGPNNANFDAYLRQNTSGGRIHEFSEVCLEAEKVGLVDPQVEYLPANNQCVIWTRRR